MSTDRNAQREAIRRAEAEYKAAIQESAALLAELNAGMPIDTAGFQKLQTHLITMVDEFSLPLLLSNMHLVRGQKGYYDTHIINVAILNVEFGRILGFSRQEQQKLAAVGLFIDMGMLRLPAHILEGKQALSRDDRWQIRGHTQASVDMLYEVNQRDAEVTSAVLHHHEHFRGEGYPGGMAGEGIPLYARITTIADSYDAATARRAYKEQKSPFAVLAELSANERGALDPTLTTVIVNSMAEMLLGQHVLLSDHSVGRVVSVDKANLAYPTVRIVGRNVQTGPELYPVSLSSFVPLF